MNRKYSAGMLFSKGHSVTVWLATIGLFVAATPFEITVDASAQVLVIRFVSILAVVPFFWNRRNLSLPVTGVILLFTFPIIYALSNIRTPGLWAIFTTLALHWTIFIAILIAREKKSLIFIDRVLRLHIFFLILQIFMYFALDTLIQPHDWFFPSGNSRSGFHLEILRLGGAHIEPGTYANYMFLLLVLRTSLGGSLSDGLAILTGLTLAVTMSAWGLAATAVYLLALLTSSENLKRRTLIRVLFILSIILTVFQMAYQSGYLDWALNYFAIRYDTSQGSAGSRSDTLIAFFDNFDNFLLIGIPEAISFCETCQSPQDLGLWSQLFVRLGVPAAGVFFTCVAIASWRRPLALQLMIWFSFTGKYVLSEPVTWLFLVVSISPLFLSVRTDQNWAPTNTFDTGDQNAR